ncbi:MAG TPA: hypothetical protein VJJ83_04510, partial [Candidatus Babeliales bacterium]|nr:hypothetical protein [Candidatus Babeliales bacterium]
MKRAVAVFALVFTLFFGCQAPCQRRQFLRQKAGAVQVVNAAHFPAPATNLPSLPAPARPAAELMAAATPLIAAGGLRFQLELTGIECQFCARAALELLERVPEVQSARYLPMPQSP